MIVDADNHAAAVDAIADLLGTTHLGGEAVIGMCFDKLTKDSRRKIADELEDLNKKLTFTLIERPASSGEGLELRPFAGESDRDIFTVRCEDVRLAGDGSGGPAGAVDEACPARLRVGPTATPRGTGTLRARAGRVETWVEPEVPSPPAPTA